MHRILKCGAYSDMSVNGAALVRGDLVQLRRSVKNIKYKKIGI